MGKFIGLISILISVAIIGWLLKAQIEGPDSSTNQPRRAVDIAAGAAANANLTLVRSGISTFESLEGRLPENLDEVKAAGFIESIPSNVVYDPESGKVWME